MTILLATAAFAATGTLTPSPYQIVLNSSGQVVNGACIWTYLAGTSTPTNTWTDKALSAANSNPIQAVVGHYVAYLQPGVSYKFVIESACTPPAHGSLIRSQDNIDAVPASATALDTLGTAGESLTAGQAVYLSDGSGGKTAGSWYKADTANAYSSTTPEVGIAPSSITSGNSGTIRLAGQVTGLSSLTVGAEYFVGSSGALTSTASNKRHLGHADTTTSLILTGNPAPPTLANSIEDFRLTLSSGIPVTATDVTAATTLYCTPKTGNRIALFDSVGASSLYSSAEFSIAVPATTSQMYDIFAYSNAGVPTLELLAWTNDTTRATALVLTTTGSYTKSGDLTRRYLGSFRTTTVSGQTEDSATKRYLWNYYNRAPRPVQRNDATATWTYTTATWRQANAAVANQIEVVNGIAESMLDLKLVVTASSSTGGGAGLYINLGIGEDSTTTPVATAVALINIQTLTTIDSNVATLTKIPAVGRHFYAWLEASAAAGTTTFYGSNNTVGVATTASGLFGIWWS